MTAGTRVDTVLFDLDDTLCVYERSGRELLALAFEDVGVDPFFTVEDYYGRYDEFVAEGASTRDIRERCFATLARERGYDPALGRALADAYAAERDHAAVRPTPGACEALELLARDHRLGLVTNGGPEMQAIKLDELGIGDAFEVLVHAGYDAPPKPEPDPFHRALDALGSTPERAVHVGNSLEADVPGAQAAGLRAAWFTGAAEDPPERPEPEPDYRLASLRELTAPPWRDA